MARDNAPVPHTCPMIDEIISAIDSVDWEETYCTKKDLIETMEKIRKANDSLRSWGNDKHIECEQLEKDIKYKDREIEGLVDEVKDLKHEVSKLEDELSEVSV
jgi:uncharacterized protein YoxC